MASNTCLRQSSRVLHSNRLHLSPSRTRHDSPKSLFTASVSAHIRSPRVASNHALQQARSFSLWGSGSSSKSTPTAEAPSSPQANFIVKDPTDFESSGRAIKASNNISADTSFDSHPPNSLEPQFLESAQQAILQTTARGATDPASVPIEEIPERIGYLKEICGLDYGWGTSTIMEWVLEHLHITAGLSWTASAVVLGIVIRSAMFPALVTSSRVTGKLRAVQKHLAPLQKEVQTAVQNGDQARAMQYQMQVKALYKEADIKLWKAFVPPLLQIPFGFGAWRVLRGACTLPVPGFVTEAWLWTNDLTFSDPYFILPVVSAGLTWATMSLNKKAQQGPGSTNNATASLLGKVLPPITFLFLVFQPGAVQVYFISSSAVGLVSAFVLQQRLTRKFFDLPPLPGATPTDQPTSPPESSVSAIGLAATPKESSYTMRTRARESQKVIEAKARVIEEEKNAAHARERSFIDRGVDSVKGGWQSFKGDTSGVMDRVLGKVEERQAKVRRENMEKWEAKAKREHEDRRKERNRAVGYDEPERRRR